LNAFAALEAKTRTAVREQIIAAVVNDGKKKEKKIPETSLYRLADVEMHLPVEIPEYTDFFCSLEHCRNVSPLLSYLVQGSYVGRRYPSQDLYVGCRHSSQDIYLVISMSASPL
jgi:fumarylacetoacetase